LGYSNALKILIETLQGTPQKFWGHGETSKKETTWERSWEVAILIIESKSYYQKGCGLDQSGSEQSSGGLQLLENVMGRDLDIDGSIIFKWMW
jgi:hypothetical protein